MSERLSAELISHAEFLEQDMLQEQTTEEQAEWTKHQHLVELIVKAIVSTRELRASHATLPRVATICCTRNQLRMTTRRS